jgi:hypothetical protein
MTRGQKLNGISDINKGILTLNCGVKFIGRPKMVILQERLHKKNCDFCKIINAPPTKVTEFNKGGTVVYKLSRDDINKKEYQTGEVNTKVNITIL